MNENFFSKKMTEKSDEELQQIIGSKSYTEDAKNAATWELEKRQGQPVVEPADELAELLAEPAQTTTLSFDDDSLLDATEAGLPVLYRKGTIIFFCFLFSSVFGVVLYAMNLYALKKMSQMYAAIIFGVAYTVLMVIAVINVPQFSNLGIIMNVGCGVILTEGLWNTQIGKEFKFAPRSVLIPSIIGVIFTAVIIFMLFEL